MSTDARMNTVEHGTQTNEIIKPIEELNEYNGLKLLLAKHKIIRSNIIIKTIATSNILKLTYKSKNFCERE